MIGAVGSMIGRLMVSAVAAGAESPMQIDEAPVQAVSGFEHFTEVVLVGSIDLGIVAIFVGLLLCLLRLVRGPTLIDRGVAADTVSLQVVGLVLLLTVRLSSLVDFDAVLIVSILGFASTVAFAQFIGRRGATT